VLVAVLGVIVPFILGFAYMKISHGLVESIFVGAAMVATSVGITARVLADNGVLATRMARVILGAAVLDDILGLLVLAVVSSMSTGQVDYLQLGIVTVEAIGFTLLIVFLGPRMVRKARPTVERLRAAIPRSYSLSFCAWVSHWHPCTLAWPPSSARSLRLGNGRVQREMALAGERAPDHGIHDAFLFVLLGAQMNLKTVMHPGVVLTAAIVCLLAVLSKVIGCGLGSLRLGWKPALQIGVGMVPRGEVGLIVAAVGLGLHTISDAIYSVVLLMSIVTTLFAPPVLRLLLRGQTGLQLIGCSAGVVTRREVYLCNQELGDSPRRPLRPFGAPHGGMNHHKLPHVFKRQHSH